MRRLIRILARVVPLGGLVQIALLLFFGARATAVGMSVWVVVASVYGFLYFQNAGLLAESHARETAGNRREAEGFLREQQLRQALTELERERQQWRRALTELESERQQWRRTLIELERDRTDLLAHLRVTQNDLPCGPSDL